MKNLKNALVSSAFIAAFVLAFITSSASKANNASTLSEYGKFSTGCQLGDLVESNCVTTPTFFGRCTVILGFEIKEAFDSINGAGLCSEPLYKTSL